MQQQTANKNEPAITCGSQGQDRKMNYKEKGLILKRIEKYRSEGA